jgi:spore germination cell wall hydrolase CwlJ-like protein
MSITRTAVSALVAVLALTVMAPGHAEEVQSYSRQVYNDATDRLQGLADTLTQPIIQVNPKEVACLARNIFFEAGGEPEEGKVAVGLVTINRSQDPRFPKTVCGVVDQKVTRDVAHQGTVVKKTVWGNKTETQTVWSKLTICQFSWRCMFVRNPKSEDERWVESQRVAQELLENPYQYSDLRSKYSDALYFHATSIRPSWARQKAVVGRIGGHFFYAEKNL